MISRARWAAAAAPWWAVPAVVLAVQSRQARLPFARPCTRRRRSRPGTTKRSLRRVRLPEQPPLAPPTTARWLPHPPRQPPTAACPLPTSTAIAQDDAPDAAATAAAAYDARNPPPLAAAAAAQDGALFAEESSKLGSLGFPPFAHVAADGHLCTPTAQGSSAACAQVSLGAAVNVNVNAQAYFGAAAAVSKAADAPASAAQIREGVHAQIREDVGGRPSDETRVTKGCGQSDETRVAMHAGALAGSCLCNLEHVSAAHEHAPMALGWPLGWPL